MNLRQWKKACKKAAAECARRWPGDYEFVPSDGTDTVMAPRHFEPRTRNRRHQRLQRRYTSAPKGTPLLVTKDYWGEVDIETAADTLKYRSEAEDTDWAAIMNEQEQAA